MEIFYAFHAMHPFKKILNGADVLNLSCQSMVIFITYEFLADVSIVIHFHIVCKK